MCERNERNALAPRMLLEAAPAPWEKKALRRAETAAERFGLRLSPEAYERLGEERRQALRETRRLELGEGILPALTQHYEILNIQNIHLNLYLMELQFGIHLAPNMLSIIGVILAAILFRHLQ